MPDEEDHLANEQRIGRRTRRENPEETALCEAFLNYLTAGFNRLGTQAGWEERPLTILRLAALGYNSLRWAIELLLKGYYTQANALSRTAWECWLHGAYLNLYAERPLDEWRDFKTRPPPGQMRRLVSDRAAQEGPIDRLGFQDDMDSLYSQYSEYLHPSDRALRVLVTRRDQELWLRLGGDFDGLLLLEATSFFCSAASMLSTLFYFLLPNDAEYHADGGALRETLADWRRRLPRPADEPR